MKSSPILALVSALFGALAMVCLLHHHEPYPMHYMMPPHHYFMGPMFHDGDEHKPPCHCDKCKCCPACPKPKKPPLETMLP